MRITRTNAFSAAVAAATLGLAASTASAVTIVAPGDLEFVEGNSNNCFPYICGAQRYQQVYNAAHFGGMTGIVDQLLYRVDGEFFGNFSNVYDIEIRLSHTSVSAATLSTTFANNIGADETLVLDENALVIGGSGGAPGPNPFNIVVDLDDLFSYNGIDNLLVDITVFSGAGGPQFDSTRRGVAIDQMERVWGPVGSSTGSIFGDQGLVTAFVFGAAAAPEPATVAMLGLGLLALGARGRKQGRGKP